MTKYIFSIFFIGSSAFAFPSVGDKIVQTGYIQEGTNEDPQSEEMEILSENVSTNSFIVQSITQEAGSQKKVERHEYKKNALISEELLQRFVDKCPTPQDIQVGAGSFHTCFIESDDVKVNIRLWVGVVPFGTVKSIITNKQMHHIEYMELQYLHLGD